MDPEVAGSKPVTHPIPSPANSLISCALSLVHLRRVSAWLRRGCRFGMKNQLRERDIEPTYRLFISPWNQMATTIHRDLDRGMPQAQALTQMLMVQAVKIELLEPKRDKYFRILARVMADDQEVVQELVKAGLARPYEGGKKERWCPE